MNRNAIKKQFDQSAYAHLLAAPELPDAVRNWPDYWINVAKSHVPGFRNIKRRGFGPAQAAQWCYILTAAEYAVFWRENQRNKA
jgi:hypothetical protein